MSSKAKTAVRPTPPPAHGVVPPPEKAVAPIPVSAVVRAYLEQKLGELRHKLQHLQEERREIEVGAIAQLNRAIGQKDGQIAALEEQIKGIETDLQPPAEDVPEEHTPDPEPVAA